MIDHEIFSESNQKLMKKIWDDNGEQPISFLMSVTELVKFTNEINETLKIIDNSKNPRLVVLLTWLLIDYTIRDLLIRGLDLYKYESKDFQLLPDSFARCLNLLKQLKKDQNNKKSTNECFRVNLPGKFGMMIYKDKNFFKKFYEYEQKYYEKYYPEYKGQYFYEPVDFTKYRNVGEGWIETVNSLDDKWFKFAEEINGVRNNAVHRFSEKEIFNKFDLHGSDLLTQLKEKCKEYLKAILRLKDQKSNK